MRTRSSLLALSITLVLGGPAVAQGQAGARYPRPMSDAAPIATPESVVTTTSTPPPVGDARHDRWGSRVGGRWWGGANAPGGWPAYRRPVRGMVVPAYWNSPRFGVSDWAVHMLPQPPVGYRWSRYYDDAILIDARGAVYDSVPDVDWDGRGVSGRGDARGDTGLGGAAIGAVAGGVAGNLVAGRGNRLGGTLIGAGVGAAAGYAIDQAEDRHRRMPPGYGDGRPDYGDSDSYAPPPLPPAMGRRIVTRDGTTVTTTTTVGTLASGPSGYYDGGYYYPAPTVTTVVVQGAPVITTSTTTTTEVVRAARSRAPRHGVRGKLVRR